MSEARKQPIQEFVLEKVLTEMDLDMDRQVFPTQGCCREIIAICWSNFSLFFSPFWFRRFVDMCLLCGSDFCETIKGVSPAPCFPFRCFQL